MHRALVRRCILERREPHALHMLTGLPCLGLGIAKANHRPALRADEIIRRDADGPSKARSLTDDLIKRVNRLGTANAINRLHLLAAHKHLHAEGNGAELEY